MKEINSTFFEYRMDQYTKSGIVGRETTKATAAFGVKIFDMVVDNLVDLLLKALEEEIPASKNEYRNRNYNNNKNNKHRKRKRVK